MHKNYYELSVKVKKEFIDLIADYILNICDEAIEVGSEKIIIRSESDLTFVKDSLVSLTKELGDSFKISFHLSEKENQDWIKRYQDSVQPIEAGKFYIFPSWYEEKEGLINIKIDPALAFGSGHHATTFSCLKAIDTYVKEGDNIIDVGCGSGILGLACKKLGAEVDLCDTDPVSVHSCKENFQLNDETYRHLWEGSIDKAEEKYDVVIANIIADILKLLSSDLKSAMKQDGTLILSGILDKKEDVVKQSFASLHLVERVLKDEWVTLVYKQK